MSQAGRWLVTPGPLPFPSVFSRGNLGVTTLHAWPSISHQVFLELGVPPISQASLWWRLITDCMPTLVRPD